MEFGQLEPPEGLLRFVLLRQSYHDTLSAMDSLSLALHQASLFFFFLSSTNSMFASGTLLP